ncbi:zinc-binding dehydrogenase [Streptomyces sp. NPDC050564]|uniref:zinc-binding dehydrogenase n=1 Tax=Streptomyces sp. NPDC050564 TaxID=3365631 RepID=UPI0037A99026
MRAVRGHRRGSLDARKVVDYAGSRFEDHVADVDVVFHTVGGDTQTRPWTRLRPGDVVVRIVTPADVGTVRHHAARGVSFVVEPARDWLDSISELITSGRLSPEIHRGVPLAQTRAGFEALEKEYRRGKYFTHVSDG